MASGHVVVIGGGVVGLCSADELLTQGFKVTILERDANTGNGCSQGNGGLIVPSHFEPLAQPGMIAMGLRMLPDKRSPFAIHGLTHLEVLSWIARFMSACTAKHVEQCAPTLLDLNLQSRTIYEETYTELAKSAGYQHQGELMICRTQAKLDGEKHLAEKANRLGMKTRLLSKSDLRAEEPDCEIDAEGAVYFEDDAKLTPSVFIRALRQRVLDRGANLLDSSSVKGFRTENGKLRSVQLEGSEIEADEFVLAAGVWSAELAKKLGLNVPLLAGKGYGFTVANPPQTPKLPALLIEGRLAVTPMNDGLRFVGTMELGPPNDTSINQNRVEGMRRSIAEYYPAFRNFDLKQAPVWCGLRPCPPDGMPSIGRTKRFSNLTFATGHGMMGMSLGPISGRLVAQVLSNQTPCVNLKLLSPDRYA